MLKVLMVGAQEPNEEYSQIIDYHPDVMILNAGSLRASRRILEKQEDVHVVFVGKGIRNGGKKKKEASSSKLSNFLRWLLTLKVSVIDVNQPYAKQTLFDAALRQQHFSRVQ